MAKRHNTDETPIQFHIPGPGRKSRAPIPINQPHWKHGKRYYREVSIFVIFMGALLLLLFSVRMQSTPLLCISGFIILFCIISLVLDARNYIKNKKVEKEQAALHSPKKAKKQTKRRKDYR
jgi:hypothetical protein